MSGEKNKNLVLQISVGEDVYDLNFEFTARECGRVKRIAHIKGLGEIATALEAGDLEVCVALAVVAMERAKRHVNVDDLLDAKMGNIRVDIPDVKEVEIDPL